MQAHSSCGVAAGAVGCGSDVGLLPYLRRPGAAMNRDKRIEIAEEVYACIQRARLPLLGEGREGLNENSCNKQERSTGAPDDVL